jgi:hypothetical protein
LNELPKRELALTPAEKAQRLASIKSELLEAERLEIALIAMHTKIRAASLRIFSPPGFRQHGPSHRERAFVASSRVPYVPHVERMEGSYVSASMKFACALPVSAACSSTLPRRTDISLAEQRSACRSRRS